MLYRTFSCIRTTRLKGILVCIIIVTITTTVYAMNFCFLSSSKYSTETEVTSEKMAAVAKGKSLLLIVFVMSNPRQNVTRNMIRRTWASDVPANMKVMFVVGVKGIQKTEIQSLLRENAVYNDVVMLENLIESYTSLTSKLLEMLVWANENLDFKYLMKVDEDSFVRLNLFARELSELPQNRLYWGFFDGDAPILKTGKWAEKEYFLCDRYIPYAVGGGYVISSDLVKYIALTSQYLKKFSNEDVSLGTWLAPLDIHRIHDERFDTESISRGCNNSYMITHKKSVLHIMHLYNNLEKIGKLCRDEYVYMGSYQYNWEVPPWKCCLRNSVKK